jgi:hypothetical protein
MDNSVFSGAPLDEEGFMLTDRWYCKETDTFYPVGTTTYEIGKELENMSKPVYDKAFVTPFHAVSGEDHFDDDDLFVLVTVPNWAKGRTYYYVSLISDEPSGPCCFGHHWGHLDADELDTFVRESVVNYYRHIYCEYDEDFLLAAERALEISYMKED